MNAQVVRPVSVPTQELLDTMEFLAGANLRRGKAPILCIQGGIGSVQKDGIYASAQFPKEIHGNVGAIALRNALRHFKHTDDVEFLGDCVRLGETARIIMNAKPPKKQGPSPLTQDVEWQAWDPAQGLRHILRFARTNAHTIAGWADGGVSKVGFVDMKTNAVAGWASGNFSDAQGNFSISRKSAAAVVKLGPTHFATDGRWVHFRNGKRFLSVRREGGLLVANTASLVRGLETADEILVDGEKLGILLKTKPQYIDIDVTGKSARIHSKTISVALPLPQVPVPIAATFDSSLLLPVLISMGKSFRFAAVTSDKPAGAVVFANDNVSVLVCPMRKRQQDTPS